MNDIKPDEICAVRKAYLENTHIYTSNWITASHSCHNLFCKAVQEQLVQGNTPSG